MDKKEEYKPLRVWKRTHYLLKLLSSLYQESIVELLDRLANEEMERAKERGSVTNFPGTRGKGDEKSI